jgi:Zn-dependent membrane protease YugP
MFEDSTFWLFVAPGLLLGLYAQARIKANYVRYSRVGTSGGSAGGASIAGCARAPKRAD